MVLKYLKNIRLVVSVIFFLSISLVYLDITNVLPKGISIFLTSFQIFPSTLKIIFYSGISSLGLLFVFLLTVFFGRVYCSTICPLGTYQDFIIRISRRNRKRRWFRYTNQLFSFHYILFAAIVVAALFGSVLLLNLLEPFSNFGRMLNTLVAPIIVFINNTGAMISGNFNLYLFYQIPFPVITLSVGGVIVVFFLTVTYLSYNHGRLFCNSLCPAGALLGLLSRVSIFKLAVNESSCTHCKLCEKVCKARCIDSNLQKLDFSACVGCFNCIDACHTDGIIYEYHWKSQKAASVIPVLKSRRNFLRSTTIPALAALLPFTDSLKTVTASGYDAAKQHPVTPPGSKSIAHFSSTCTACQLCVTSCPTNVLQPALFDYGISGILQPRMDYLLSFCNYDCTICTDICPTGAILPLMKEEKKLTQVGKSKFYKDDCIVITKKKDCGACSEHCPTKAVNMVLHDGVFLPEVKEEICIGCGACEHACPTTPRKAIYVEANFVHVKAEKPPVQKIKKAEQKPLEEFPF